MRVSNPFGSPFGMLSIRSWALVVILLVMIGAINWSLGASPAASAEPSLIAFHARVGLGAGWKTNVVLVNSGPNANTTHLFAYDADESLLAEIPGGSPLLPGERRVYSQGDDVFPERTTAPRVQSDNPLLSFFTLESLNGKGLEVILPTTTPNPMLIYPLVREAASWWNQLSLLHAGSTER